MKNLIPVLASTLLIVPILVEAQVRSPYLDPMLLDAAAARQTDLVKSLLDSGANMESKNNVGATPLIFASVKGHRQIVKLLLDRGGDVNAKTTTGITALIAAASAGDADIVKLMLEKGADFSAKDQQGRTALNMAEATGDTEVYALLKSADKPPVSTSGTDFSSPRTKVITGANNFDGAIVRVEPSPQGRPIGYLPIGSTITESGEVSNGYVKLTSPTPGGWVAQTHLGSRYPELPTR